MNSSGLGVLPSQDIERLIDSGYIQDVSKNFINPSSIDVPLSDEAYELESSILPCLQHVRVAMDAVGARRHDLSKPLQRGRNYLIRAAGEWVVPSSLYAYANPKSSTGRVNVLVRLIADGSDMYDKVSGGFKDELWLLVRPDSFPVKVEPGLALTQLRFFTGQAFLDKFRTELAIKKPGLIFTADKRKRTFEELYQPQDSIVLSLSVEGQVGWECRGSENVLDMTKVHHHRPEDFFTPLYAENGGVLLKKGVFYITSTDERVLVPPDLAAELRAVDVRFGDFRVHAAGFIDSGWGVSTKGRRITLEITTYEDIHFRHGQSVARIRYEQMLNVPTELYDDVSSNYTKQKVATLSKHFKNV